MNPDLNSGDENPYDFIFKQDTQTAPVTTQNFGNRNRQLLIFVGFVAVILIVISIGLSFFFSASQDKGTEAISLRAYQSEIERILDVGNKNLVDRQLMKKLVTLELVLITDSGRVSSVIADKGIVPTPVQLAQHRNTSSDSTLESSLQIDNHDEVYEEIIDSLVARYYQAARAAEGAAKTTREQERLKVVRENIETMYSVGDTQENNTDSQSQESGSQS